MLTKILAILIFDDVELLYFCGPFEVFSVANRFTDPPALGSFRNRPQGAGRGEVSSSRQAFTRTRCSIRPHPSPGTGSEL